jgi:membrane fusion protein (multidrug efflux system)
MSVHFSRSLRSLEAKTSFRNRFVFLLTTATIVLWAAWSLTASVGVYATTGAARLVVDRENYPVDAPVDGRVLSGRFDAGRRVSVGDVLLELDGNHERLARSEALAPLAQIEAQLASLQDELHAEERALEGERRGAEAARSEASAKALESMSASELASEEARRLLDLQGKGLVSELDALRGRKLAEERQSQARAAEFAASRQTQDLRAREQDRIARIARLRNEIAVASGRLDEALAASEKIGYQIEQRIVRAPVAGTLAEVAPLKVGSMVGAGDRLCTIVPDGELKVVAFFAPSTALGRVRSGQSARVRLEGFPWTQYGSTLARVSNVSGEVRDGQVRVELALDAASNNEIPFQHGLPAEVDVEVERLSPLQMILRSVGERMQVSAAASRP